MVGNGTSSSYTHNARTLDWQGNEYLDGRLRLGQIEPIDPNHVTTKIYVDTADAAKADKVANAINGHLAGLDSNGNLTDSGMAIPSCPVNDGTYILQAIVTSGVPTYSWISLTNTNLFSINAAT
jgi:hypothetical protein